YDHVDILRLGNQRANGGAVGGLDHLYRLFRQAGFTQTDAQALGNCLVRINRFRATAQDGGVAGFQAQGRRIDGHVRARLVDDADHAERHAHAADLDAGRAVAEVGDGTDRVSQGDDLLEPLDHAVEARRGQFQAVEQGRLEAVVGGALHVARVGVEDGAAMAAQGGGNGGQRPVLGAAVGTGQMARGGTGALSDVGDILLNIHSVTKRLLSG